MREDLRPHHHRGLDGGSVGPEPLNVLDRINWAVNTLRKGTGRDKENAEVLGYLYHLVGDVHQPLHTTTRYTAAQADGDAGGNGFPVKMPEEARIRNLHSFWDAAGGAFGFDSPKRPLDEAGKARIRALADEVMKAYPADANAASWKDVEPLHWVEESNTLGRQVVYKNIKEGDAPSKAYTNEAQRIARIRIALAGYRLAEVLNRMSAGN
ncbi:MAG: S1/P1 nuclease [Acidobacteria bacterium]|nr:S1/P1 nuclease [Acidobacteriota bacterium]